MADTKLSALSSHANAAGADLVYGVKGGSSGAFSVTQLRAGLAATTVTFSNGDGITGGGDLSANRTLALTGQALALHNLGSNGVVARTGAGTVAARSIAAGSGIAVTNGDGVSGNPTVAVAAPATAQAAIAPVVTIGTNTTLTAAAHAGRTLVCTAAVTLTVNASTDFATVGDSCTVYADGGAVTIAATGATVNIPAGDTLVIASNGSGFLRRLTAADTYALNGTLVAV